MSTLPRERKDIVVTLSLGAEECAFDVPDENAMNGETSASVCSSIPGIKYRSAGVRLPKDREEIKFLPPSALEERGFHSVPETTPC